MTDQSRLQRALLSGGIPMLAAAVASLRDAVVELNPGLLPHDDWAKALSRDLDEREVHPIARAHPAPASPEAEVFDVPVLENLRKDFELVDLGLASGHDGFGDRTAGRAAIKRIRRYFDGCDRLEEFTTAIASMVSSPYRVTDFPGEPQTFHGGDIHDVARLQQRTIEKLRGELEEAKRENQRVVLVAAEAVLASPAPASPPSGEKAGDMLQWAIDSAGMLCEFAYEQGFHELGDDPVKYLIQAKEERDTLRAEVNRLNAEAFELKRMAHNWEELYNEALLTCGRMNAVVEAARAVANRSSSPDGRVPAYEMRPLVAALSALDQPSEPKT